MKKSLFFFLLQVSLVQSMEWSSPETLFSVDDVDGTWSMIAIHPTQESAQAVWLARSSDGSSEVYAAEYSGGTWGSMQSISTAVAERAGVGLVVNSSGVYSLICEIQDETNRRIEASYNSNGTWAALEKLSTPITITDCFSLHVSMGDDDKAVVSWIDPSGLFQALHYADGVSGDLYPESESTLVITEMQTDFHFTIFTAETASPVNYVTYTAHISPTMSPSDMLLLPLQSHRPSLCLAARSGRQLYAFQNQFSKFFIAATGDTTELSYSVIATPKILIDQACVAIHPTGEAAVAIWKLSDGTIHVSRFNGTRWSASFKLSMNGTQPKSLIHPISGNPMVFWADLTTNTIRFSEYAQGNWSPFMSLSSEGSTFSHLSVQASLQGNIAAIWCRRAAEDDASVVEVVTNRKE